MNQNFVQPRFTGARFDSHTFPVDPLNSWKSLKISPLVMQFEELAQIEAGWYEGQGIAPDMNKLKTIAQKLMDFYPEHLLLPTIIPMQDGNLLLEWDAEGDPSTDIDLGSMRASFHAFGPSDEDIEGDFPLGTNEDFESFFTFLSEHIQSRPV